MSDFNDMSDPDSARRADESNESGPTEESRREEAFYRYFQAAARVPWLTMGFMFGSAAVFGGLISQGFQPFFSDIVLLRASGANYGPLTSSGEPWRLFTSTFLHGNIIHLATTLYLLWQLGRFAERLIGHLAYLILFLLSGLTAGVMAVLWSPDQVTVSASGSAMGIIGLLFALLVSRGDELPDFIRRSMTRSAVLNFFIIMAVSIAEPTIPLAGHAGGLVAGFALGFLLIGPLTLEGRAGQMGRNLKAAVAGTALLAGVLYTMPPLFDPFMIVEKHLKAKSYDAGLAELSQLPNANPDDIKMIRARIALLEAAGRMEEVRKELDKAISVTEKHLELAVLYETRAQLAYQAGDWQGVVDDFTRALSYLPEHLRAVIYNQRGFGYLMLDQYKEAEADWLKSAELIPTFGVDKKAAAEARAGSLENIGLIYIRNGEWEEAMKWTESITEMHAGMVWNALFRAIAAGQLGKENDARSALAIWQSKKKPSDLQELKRFLPPEHHELLESESIKNGSEQKDLQLPDTASGFLASL